MKGSQIMEMPDLANMSQQDKIKLGSAIGGLLIALVLIYWFGIRTPSPTAAAPADLQPAPAVAVPGGPPPAGNRRVAPDLANPKGK